MSEPRIRVGIGGWTYPPWRGTFYPEGLPHARELEYGSRQFRALEINATFYGRQKPSSWSKWAAATPNDFQFAIKGSRFVVTRKRLADAGEGLGNFFAQGLGALGPKLGPILWMFDERRAFDRDDLARFFDLLPGHLEGLPLRHAVEARHESFQDDTFFNLCRNHDIAVVFADSETTPAIVADTASFTYSRLKRMSEDVQTGYDDDALARFAGEARKTAASGRDAFIFMINGAKVRAPAAALALQQRLGIAPAAA